LEWILQCNNRHSRRIEKAGTMDPKLAMLFVLIGAVIGLSYLSEDNVRRVQRLLARRDWREYVPLRRRS
jgi:hypothetical protein